jgi:transposase
VLEKIEIKNLNHLGIIAGIIDEIGLVEIVNEQLGTSSSEIVSPGVIIKAIILNGLGFVSRPLYLFSQFFEDKSTEHLLGQKISPWHLNDDKIGRVMDKCYDYGITELFLLLALAAVKKYQVNLEYSHLDSSSFSVHGEYQGILPQLQNHSEPENTQAELVKEIPIKITHGYSRDHRPDLKQFILNLIVSGDGDVPIFIETGSGNQSDKKVFGEIAQKYKKQLEFETTIVSDSALYTENNLKLIKEISWITRVPLSIKEAKKVINNLSSDEFTLSKFEGYAYKEIESNYAQIKQRWIIVESQARKKSDLEKLEKKIIKEYQLTSKKLVSLAKKDFESELEANLKLKEINSKLKYHLISQSLITKKSAKKYNITAEVQSDSQQITLLKRRAGRFIIATNKLENSSFTSNDILEKYKEQQAPERGFAFLKDPLFFADSVFLKNSQRVETMAMLMGLCLLVYSRLAKTDTRLVTNGKNRY